MFATHPTAVLASWRIGIWLFSAAALLPGRCWAQTSVSIQSLPDFHVRISWAEAGASFDLESATTVNGPWQPSGLTPQLAGALQTVELTPAAAAHFFRLRQAGSAPLTIESSSPAPGESDVAVTRETIFYLSGPLAPDAALSTTNAFAMAAGRKILSRVELSGDRRKATLFYLERLPADARVEVQFDGTGIFDAGNRPVDLDGDGVVGGVATLEFDTLSTTALATTGIEGHVFASEKNADGSNHPLQNVTVTVDGMEETLRTTSDQDGYFRLSPCPAGRFFVSVDGRTAEGSQWPGGAYYPFVGKAWEATPGRTNNLAGGSGVVYLPLIQADALKVVSATNVTTVTFAASLLATNPALAGVEISVPPNALFADTGLRGGRVGIAPVPADRLPEPLPMGLNLPLVITIQTDGPSNFDQPVPVKFPNLPDPATGIKLGPGEKTVLWSFNHDTGRWEPQGTMTISADGNFAVSDPGVGVRQPGWHGVAPGTRGDGPRKRSNGKKDCEDANGNGYCDEDDAKRCQTDRQKTINAGVDALAGFVELPGEGPLATCINAAGVSASQGFRDCRLDPNGCRETVALKILDFSIDCGLSFVPTSAEFKEAVTWIKRVKGLFDAGLAYKSWQLCKDTAPTSEALERQSIIVGGVPTGGNPFLQQYEVEMRLHRFVELAYGNGKWAEIDPAEWGLTAAILNGIRSGTQAGSDGGKTITTTERNAILGLARPRIVDLSEVQALITRMERLLNQQAPDGGDIDSVQFEDAANGLNAILTEVTAEGWTRVFDGYPRAVAILVSLSQSGTVQGQASAGLLESQAVVDQDPYMPPGRLFYRMIDLGTGFERFGRLNSHAAFDGIILRPSAVHLVMYFDPESGRAGATYFTSAIAGKATIVPGVSLVRPPGLPDSDGDGLSDLAEIVLGTSSLNADSDGDGVPDGAEVTNGTSPTDDQGIGVGTVATRDTPGKGVEIDTVNDFAVVADATAGIAVFNVANPLAPVLVSQYTQNNFQATAVAAAGDYVVAVPGLPTGTGRFQIFRLVGDGSLAVGASLSSGVLAQTVAAAGRYAYVPGRLANAPTLMVVQLRDGFPVRQVAVPGTENITALAIDGDVLWAANNVRLLSFRIEGDNLTPLAEMALNPSLRNAPLETGPALTAGGNRVYLGDFLGFRIFDASQPASPALLFAPPTTQAAIHDLALSGTGLALPVTSFSGVASLAVSGYDVRNDRSTNLVFSFDTPGQSRAVVLHRGYLLVADDDAGLAMVNFLAPDRGTNAPTITLRAFMSHPPSSQEADEPFFVSTVTSDDVQVRDVEFYIDGVPVGRTGKFPFAATLNAPPKTPAKTNFRLRAKASDTGGNKAWSDELVLTLLPDSTPLRFVTLSPTNGSILPRGSLSVLSAFFDSTADLNSLRVLTLTNAGLDNVFGTADDFAAPDFQIAFDEVERRASLRFAAPVTSGKYRFQVGSSISDLAGNQLGTNIISDFTIPAARVIATTPVDKLVFPPGALSRFEVLFDERLSPPSITPASLWLISTNAPQQPIAGGRTSLSADGRQAILDFDQGLGLGTYRLLISSQIRDVYGSPVLTNLSCTVVIKDPAVWTNDVSGLWTAGTNWDLRLAPALNDNVIIDRPGANPVVTLRSLTTVTSIRSEEAFVIDGGNGGLTVLNDATFNGPLNVADISSYGLTVKNMEVGGEAILNGPLSVGGDASFHGNAAITEGDGTFRGGRTHFYKLFNTTRSLFLGGHTLVLEAGAVGTLTQNQVGFGGVNSRLRIEPGAKLDIVATNLNLNTSSFALAQGASGGVVENLGELSKRGASRTYDAVPLINGGTLNVEEGFLSLVDVTNSGTINIANNARLEIGGDFTQTAGRITGAGAIHLTPNAVLDGAYELTGLTEIAGQGTSTVDFRSAIHSTGSWLITGAAQFDGSTTELLGPVTLQGVLVLNSPGESVIPEIQFVGSPRLRGTGELVIRKESPIDAQLRVQDQLLLRFEAPQQIKTNLTVTENGRVVFATNVLWTGGALTGDIRVEAGAVLELQVTKPSSIGLPFPQAGNLRKTGGGLATVYNIAGNNVTNRTLLEIQGGSFRTAIFVQGAGELRISAGGFLNTDSFRFTGGELTGDGTVYVSSDAINRGCFLNAVVRPGVPYGVLKFMGPGFPNWQTNSHTIISIGGVNPGVEYDQITVERTIAIQGGTLEIQTAPGFVPKIGQEFTIISGSSRQGTFTTVLGVELGNGLHYQVIYEAKAVKLRVEG